MAAGTRINLVVDPEDEQWFRALADASRRSLRETFARIRMAADREFRLMRHDLRGHLNVIRPACQVIRSETRHPAVLEAVGMIERAGEGIESRVAEPMRV